MDTRPFRAVGVGVEIYDPCIVLKPEMISLDDGARVDSMTKLEGGLGLHIGRWVHIASFAHINIGGGEVTIEDGAAICPGAKIIAGSNNPDGYYMSAAAPEDMQVKTRSFVTLKEGCFIATNAVIQPGVTVGAFAIVMAGAVVTKDVAPWAIVAGIPARKIGEREQP